MEERLQKALARIYGISRRHAETWISDGMVSINGAVAHLGSKVDCEKDTIRVGSKKWLPHLLQSQFTREVWMLFKPKGVICTHDRPMARNTLEAYVPAPLRRQKWLFIGRLDKDSEGLLLLTNDGDFANRIAHPSAGIEKIYRVYIDKAFDLSHCDGLMRGRQCQGEWLQFQSIHVVNSHKLHVTLNQGKKRAIRRLLLAFGYTVLRLKRWKIGGLVLDKKLAPGQSRRLSEKEIQQIFNGNPARSISKSKNNDEIVMDQTPEEQASSANTEHLGD